MSSAPPPMTKEIRGSAPSQDENRPNVGEEITDLASLVAPSSTSALIDCFLRKDRLVVKTAHPRRAESLLPRWAIDRLIASSFLPAERLQVLRNGEVVPADVFRNSEGHIRPKALDELIAEGTSFIVNGIDDDFPSIARLSDAVERQLGHHVWVNAYITHGSGGALPAHYDDHDVIVLQVHGSKRWFGYGVPNPLPIERSPDGVDFAKDDPVWDALLGPGDLLYLPRGEVHRASVEGALSVHLTIGVEPLRGVDLLRSLSDGAHMDVAFREDLTRLSGNETLRIKERQLKDRMHALIERVDLRSFLEADDGEQPLRRLSHADRTHALGLDDVLVPAVKRGFPMPSELSLVTTMRLGGESIQLSALAVKALAFLIARDRSTLGELIEKLDGDQSEEMVREAVAELTTHALVGR